MIVLFEQTFQIVNKRTSVRRLKARKEAPRHVPYRLE
jgi:hypothetical protein